MVYSFGMGRTNIEIDESLVRKARKTDAAQDQAEIVDKALELLVRSESRKASFGIMERESGKVT